MKKKKSVYVEPYDVDKLREIYALNVEYLDAVKQLQEFNNLITKDVEKYESESKEKFGLNKLKKEEEKLSDKLWEYEELKPGYQEREDGVKEFDMFSEEELKDYFETTKKYELLKRKIKKVEEKINDVVSDFKKQKKELKNEDIKVLENNVVSKGLKILDVEYLDAVKQPQEFNNLITKDVEKYESELKEKFGLNKLKKEEKKLSDKLWEYEKLKRDYQEREDGVEEFDMFSEEELEDHFETSKKYELLKRKIKKVEEIINDAVSDFKKQKKELKNEDIKVLENNVVSKGLKKLDTEKFNKYKNMKYSMEKIQKMLIKNMYNYPDVSDEDWGQDDSADMIYGFLKLNNWFGDMHINAYDKTQVFKNEKLSKNYLSTFEYFVKSLQKHTGKEYEKINIVTNETRRWHDNYAPDVFYVYTATILAPKDIAEMFKKTEKKLTKDSIEKLVKNNKKVICLTDGNESYYEDNYDDKDMHKKEKFNETYREQVREKIAKSKKSNQIEVEELFGIKEHQYIRNGEKIVEYLPTKEVAEAAFDTLEYAKKLAGLSELEKVVEKHKKQQEAEKEYEELKKSL